MGVRRLRRFLKKAPVVLAFMLAAAGSVAVSDPADEGVAPPRFPVIAWARDHAVPLATVEPGAAMQDLAAFEGIVGDARIMALGELTLALAELDG
jgi:hypothetical protein